MTETEKARIATLTAEGMPSTWIAEDYQISPGYVRQISRERGTRIDSKAWRQVWARIRTDEVLLALHRELAPPTVTAHRFKTKENA